MEGSPGVRTASQAFEPSDLARVAAGTVHAGLELIVRDLARAVGAEISVLGAIDPKRENVEVLAAWGVALGADGLPLAAGDGFAARALRFERATVEPIGPAAGGLGTAASGASVTHAVGAPINSLEGRVAVLCAGFSGEPPSGAARTLWLIDGYARIASLCLEDAEALDRLLAGGRVDGLTGCVTHSAFIHELDREIRRSNRHGLNVSCCFVDLDRFKRVNDRYGHLHGSHLLASIAGMLADEVRGEDTLGRYGGDEFVLLLPDTDEEEAAELAERLRSTITTTMINLPHDPIDASIGVAQWQPGSTGEELLAAADEALLAAKAAGGGRVIKVSKLATGRASSGRQDRATRASDHPQVRFCGHCGDRPTEATDTRVCVRCGLGVLISASAEMAPERGDAFLILDQNMCVAALSKGAQALLGVGENWALDRHIDEFLIPAAPRGNEANMIGAMLARSDREHTTAQHLDVRMRTSNGETVPFRVRLGACGPPAATLIVVADVG
jgi:diguanylate cyclase (GGDEF)-like protein